MTGTYSGQFAMEGFLNLKWPRWQRVLVTRTIAVIPTFSVAFFSQISQVTKLNDYLNAVMALQLPFATIPTIAFSSSKEIMGEFANGKANRVIAVALSAVIIGINLFFVVNTVNELDLAVGYIVLVGKKLLNLGFFEILNLFLYFAAIFGALYIIFTIYLIIHMFSAMGFEAVSKSSFVQKYVLKTDNSMIKDSTRLDYE